MRVFCSGNFSLLLFSKPFNTKYHFFFLHLLSNFCFRFLFNSNFGITFLFNLIYLMPKINKYKDQQNEKAFKISHFISVIINFIQLIALGIVLL